MQIAIQHLQDPCDVNSANFTGNADGTQVGQCLADGVPTGLHSQTIRSESQLVVTQMYNLKNLKV